MSYTKAVKLIAYIDAILLISGCSAYTKDAKELQHCSDCGEYVYYTIEAEGGDLFCAKCFVENECMICRCCKTAYVPGMENETAKGLCWECTEENTWYCSICERRIDLEDLADFENGYYLCGHCLLDHIEYPPEMASELAACSPYISRDEYLAALAND